MKKPIVKIHIGQYFASKDPAVIETILGSCISVCFFDPVMKVGGMNHILHSGEEGVSSDNSARYGINAMELLISEMMSLGAVRARLVAKVFGGGNMLGLSKEYQQGIRNTAFVIKFLQTDKIKLISQNTGGRFSRKLFYHTDTNEVLLKRSDMNVSIQYLKTEDTPFVKVKSISKNGGEIILF